MNNIFRLKNYFIILLSFISFLVSQDRPKIGLALSGGSAKGFAHTGALKVIDSLQIPIDYIAATSFGSIIGALYSMGYTAKELERMGNETDWNNVLSDLPDRKELPYFRKLDTDKFQMQFGINEFKPIAPSGLINGQRVYSGLNQWIKEYEKIRNFDDFPIPFKCIAADLITGNEVILDKGSISKAIRASCSIPSVFKPVQWGDSLLVDGGVINNLPIDVVKNMGADIIIAIDVAATPSFKSNYNVIDVVARSARMNEENRKEKQILNADIVIRPDLDHYSWFDFDNSLFQNMVDDGYKSTMIHIDELMELKKQLGDFSYTKKHINLISESIINKITILGNKQLSNAFLYRLIGVQKGDYFDVKLIEKNISQMYSLGYFKIIHYSLEEKDNGLHLIFHVEEESMQKLNVGARWDQEKGLIGIAGLLINNKYVPGLIIDNQTMLGGLFNNTLNIYYPSRTLNYPIYPFVRTEYDRRILNYYQSNSNKNIKYIKNEIGLGVGFGFLLKNYWVMELELNTKKMDLDTENIIKTYESKHKINSIKFNANLDFIDNLLLPKRGGIINLDYIYSDQSIKSDLDYSWIKFESDFYFTRNTHTLRLFSYIHSCKQNTPISLQMFNKGSNYLAGFNINQLYGNTLHLHRFEYRYKYKRDIYFHILLNNIFEAEINNLESYKNVPSFGIGTTLTSRAGNIEIIFESGPENLSNINSYKYNVSINAGYKF